MQFCQGEGVPAPYVRVRLSDLGLVWARALRTDEAYRGYVENTAYRPLFLGWGAQPGVLWGDLPGEIRQELAMALKRHERETQKR